MNERVSDDEVLRAVQAGLIRFERGIVVKWHLGKKRFLSLRPQAHPETGRYRYNLHFGKRQRTIGCNRLHFIIANRCLPDGDVDHKDKDPLNDDPSNLRDRDVSENRRDCQHRNLRKALEFFDQFIPEERRIAG